jgi:hypothetical protein
LVVGPVSVGVADGIKASRPEASGELAAAVELSLLDGVAIVSAWLSCEASKLVAVVDLSLRSSDWKSTCWVHLAENAWEGSVPVSLSGLSETIVKVVVGGASSVRNVVPAINRSRGTLVVDEVARVDRASRSVEASLVSEANTSGSVDNASSSVWVTVVLSARSEVRRWLLASLESVYLSSAVGEGDSGSEKDVGNVVAVALFSDRITIVDNAKVCSLRTVGCSNLGGDVSEDWITIVGEAGVVRSWERESVVLASIGSAASVCRANVVVIAVGRVVCMDAPQADWVRVRPSGVAVAVVAKVSVVAIHVAGCSTV